MQDYDWNDLKYVLALQRAGTLAEAGRRSGVSETTVARRLKNLEQALGICLFTRNINGTYDLTDSARLVFDHAEVLERENISLLEHLGHMSESIAGTVRLSSVPVIIQRILLPAYSILNTKHPDLIMEFVAEAKNIDLIKREADLAIRFSRPAQGGLSTKAQKLGQLEFAVYCASHVCKEEENNLEWIGYDDAHVSLPQARWTETLRRQSSQRSSSLRVTDIETALEATVNGFGKSVLPRMVCDKNQQLRTVNLKPTTVKMKRDIWLLSHADLDFRLSIIAAKTWLTKLPWK